MFLYLLLTILIELPIFFLFSRKQFLFSCLILVLANCFTWPLVNMLYAHSTIPLFLLESGVAIVEAIIIYLFLDIRFSIALLISIIQNTVTTLVGVWMNINIV